MKRFEYVAAKSVEEALGLIGGTSVAKAGGTDLVARMKDRIAAPARVVHILDVKDLHAITTTKTGVSIGAAVTLAELAADESVRKVAKALALAAGEAATPQVRNLATVGGNLCQRPRCWFYRSADFSCLKKGGEGCPAIEGDNRYHAIFANDKCPIVHPSNLAIALVALDGTIRIQGKGGARMVDAAQFFQTDDVKRENTLSEDELVVGIDVPSGWKSAYIEVRERQSFDWPLAAVAVAVKEKEARLVLGAVAPRPWRVEGAERAVLAGKASEAAEAAVAGAKPLKHNGYKVTLIKTLVPRAMAALA